MISCPDHLVELCRPGTLIEANAVIEGLEAAGINSLLQGNDLQDAFGTIGWTFAPRVLVDAEKLDSAREILSEITESQERSAATSDEFGLKCLECGVAMNEAETCPRCDWTYSVKPSPQSEANSGDSGHEKQKMVARPKLTPEEEALEAIQRAFEPHICSINTEGIGNPPAQ